MNRWLAIAGAVAMTLVAPAGASPAGPQEENGSVILPSPSPNSGEGCWPGTPRRSYLVSQGQSAGPTGSVIEIDPTTWGGKFTLEVTAGATSSEDLDMHFFVDMGDYTTDPTMMNVVASSTYQERAAGGEKGLIPPQATHVVVCLVPGTGAEAEWTYKGTPPTKKKG